MFYLFIAPAQFFISLAVTVILKKCLPQNESALPKSEIKYTRHKNDCVFMMLFIPALQDNLCSFTLQYDLSHRQDLF